MFLIKDLYEKYKKDVFIYLISITHDKALSEDLLSETFLSSIRALPNFRGDSDIKTWLFSIARHKWYEFLRTQKKEANLDLFMEYYISVELSIDKQVYTIQLKQRILELLAIENERNRKIVLMRVEGYSFYEIANTFNVSEGSARVIDFRIKKKLRDKLIEEGFEYE